VSVADGGGRARITGELDATLIVVAGAGTGKTTALVNRIVQLVRTGAASLREIAAITFTEAAAAELRQRVRDAIEAAAGEAPGDARLEAARQEVDDAAICTLHAFAQRILVEHCVGAGIPPGFEVLDGTAEHADFDARFARFADALLADPSAEPALVRGFSVGLRHGDLADTARAMHEHWDRIEDGGLAALEQLRPGPAWPPVDTTALVEALDDALSQAQWCTSGDDKLLGHILERVADARHQLRSVAGDEPASLQVLANLPPLGCTYGQQQSWQGRVADARAACAAAETARQDVLRAVRASVLAELAARLASFVMTAANERRAEGRLSFHDLLVHARRLLRHDGEATQALRRRYRRLLIDEFQDTDPIQVELTARLAAAVDGTADLGNARPGGVFVVGDPKQSIYRFRRADIETFSRVGAEIGEPIVLGTNFRSVPGILRFVNAVFAELFGDDPAPGQAAHHELDARRDALPVTPLGPRWDEGAVSVTSDGAPGTQLTFDLGGPPPGDVGGGDALPPPRAGGAGAVRAGRGLPPVMVLGGPRTGAMADVRRAAARDVAGAVGLIVGERWPVAEPARPSLVRPAAWRDVAVLIPARTSLPALEEAFEEAAIPYRLEGSEMLWGSAEVRDVLAALHAADDPADQVSVVSALRSPGLACGDDDLVSWYQAGGGWDPRPPPPDGLEDHPVATAMAVLASLHHRRWWCEPSAMVRSALEELRTFELCLASRRPRDHWHRLRWLVDQARLFDETGSGTLHGFLRWADLQAADERGTGGVGPPDPDDDAVRVMTVHGAKGLEFPVVVLAGLERADAGHGPPAVLWGEDGRPEVSAGSAFRSAGYDAAGAREKELDALEQDRLLYVGMTRARDHLVVALHHKEGAATTSAARLQEVLEHVPQLWRRPPFAADPGTEPRPEADPDAVAALAAAFGATVSAVTAPPAPSASPGPDPDAWAQERAAFLSERRSLLARTRRRPVTTATAVARALVDAERGSGEGRPVRRVLPDDDADTADALWRSADEGLQIGRAVHATLSTIDLASGTDAAGRTADEVARGRATAHGVAHHAPAVAAMVRRALASPTVVRAASARHWRELFVAVPVGDGGVLEGFVDLAFEDGDGLVVVDYKTDRAGATTGSPEAAARYEPQIASYANALEAATGRRVHRCVLVFVADDPAGEHVLEGPRLAAARGRAAEAAEALVAG